MRLTKLSTPKLRDTAKFRVNPDEAIRDYRLEKDVKASRQALTPSLWLNIRSIGKKGTTHVKFRKDFYFASNGTLTKFLGTFPEISYQDALALADEYLTVNPAAKVSKNSLASVFDKYLECFGAGWKPATILKKRKIYKKRLLPLASKTIASISVRELRNIADSIFSARKYSALQDFCELVHHIWYFARVREYLNKDIFDGIKLIDGYSLPESDGYGYIDDVTDLKILINYIQNYPNTESVRNALFFGLCSGLRAENIRNLSLRHLKKDENGYYLAFGKDEMKVEANGAEYLGLPGCLAIWLKKLAPAEGLIFPSNADTALSDATLSKALRAYSPLDAKGRIVFHSLRKVLSTFAYECDNDLTEYDIERTLSHKVRGVAKKYNKAKNIIATRKVISWWVDYLQGLGLKL